MTTVSAHPDSPAAPATVDRAIAEIRRGGMVAISAPGQHALAAGAEMLNADGLRRVAKAALGSLTLVISRRRAMVLGLVEDRPDARGGAVTVNDPAGLDLDHVAWMMDPLAPRPVDWSPERLVVDAARPGSAAEAAIVLLKLARLLPAAVLAPLAEDQAKAPGLVRVGARAIERYQALCAVTLSPVAEARVPLKDAENARIIAYRPHDGGVEHLAIIIGEPDPAQPVLVRLHSECFTGDLLGSLRCDCGDQLKGAIAEIHQAGSGVLLYLAQEGRGIGLVNKLRAYALQDQGFDTLDANLQLGFDDDERIYQPAARILNQLGITQVRLMTNNPAKMEALSRSGITVTERVSHVFPANDHNQSYLRTKAQRSGHLL